MKTTPEISPAFPFESKYVEIQGSKIHYIDEGEGDPVVFLHGNPTSSYLWRNILPYLTPHARCIAPDLIGMGKSEKPDIDYLFLDHYRYVEGFIEKLGLRNITFVVHDWGSGLGFHYASQNESNVKAVAFMEAICRPQMWEGFREAGAETGFRMMRMPVLGWFLVCVMNIFVNKILPQAIVRELTEKETAHYRAPFPTIASRKPVRVWPTQIPIEGSPQVMHRIVSNYQRWLEQSELPKLLFYADPGAIVPRKEAEALGGKLKNTTVVDIGPGHHYLQEDNPHLIGETLQSWYRSLA